MSSKRAALVAAFAAFLEEIEALAGATRGGDAIVNDRELDGLAIVQRCFTDAAKRGAFPATKRGRRWYARRSDVERWLVGEDERKATSAAAPEPVGELAAKLGIAIVNGGRR